MSKEHPYVLSIAGFDPSAGAGLLSDIKTFENHQTYGLGVITANTIQNDNKFLSLDWIGTKTILNQIDILFEGYEIKFVKIGLVKDLSTLLRIILHLKKINNEIKIIWDPIISATAGKTFHSSFDENILSQILSNVFMVTPNLDEIKILFSKHEISEQEIAAIVKEYDFNLLLKGGHSNSVKIVDKLFSKDKYEEFAGEKFEGYSKHGTGCVLSSAITSNLANGKSLGDSCKDSKLYIEKFILSNTTNLGYHN